MELAGLISGLRANDLRAREPRHVRGQVKNSTRPANRGGSKGPKSKRKLWNYPRAGKGKIRRWLPSWQFVLCSILFVLTMGIGTLMLAYATTDVPHL